MTDALRFCQRTPAAVTGRTDHARDVRAHGGVGIGLTSACGALALAFAALVSAPAPASAQDADRIWSGCTLLDGETDLAAALEELIDEQGGNAIGDRTTGPAPANIEVAFVVVYSLANVHDGQPVGSSGFTGPIICTAPGFSIDPTSQTEEIGDADILDAEDAFILRYEQTDGIKKRICHTVASNTDCFTVEGTGE